MGVSTRAKSDSFGIPAGRAASLNCRCTLGKDRTLVGAIGLSLCQLSRPYGCGFSEALADGVFDAGDGCLAARSVAEGRLETSHPPPSALINATLAVILLDKRSTAVRSFVSD